MKLFGLKNLTMFGRCPYRSGGVGLLIALFCVVASAGALAILHPGICQAQVPYGVSNAVAITTASEANFTDEQIRFAVGNLFRLIEGAFGALIMVVAGIGAIVAAAMGAYRAALGMLVVAVGSFILRSLVSLFFGINFPAAICTGAGCMPNFGPLIR